MAVIEVHNIEGKSVAQVDLPDAVFSVPVKTHVLHEVVTMQLALRRSANRRSSIAAMWPAAPASSINRRDGRARGATSSRRCCGAAG